MFSVQQELSDKMMCHNAMQISKKYKIENESLLNKSLGNHEMDIENMVLKRHNEVYKKENGKKEKGNQDVRSVTGLDSRKETCKLFGFRDIQDIQDIQDT